MRLKFAKLKQMANIFDNTISDKIGTFLSPMVILVVGRSSDQIKKAKEYILSQLSVDVGDLLEIEPGEEGKKNVITIKQSRALIHWINLTPQKKHKAVFINKSHLMTEEAANALLKTLEEPPKYSVIILFSPQKEILSTIRSRSRIISLTGQEENTLDHTKYIGAFLKSSFSRQSKSIEKIIKQEKTSDFLLSMENWVRRELLESKNLKYTSLAEEIFKTRNNLTINANARLSLENLILKFRNTV